MNNHAEQRAEWEEQLASYSDQKLIQTFNGTVGISAFNRLRGIYFDVLINELLNRGWDCSAIIRVNPITKLESRCFGNFIYLRDNKIIQMKYSFWFKEFEIFIN